MDTRREFIKKAALLAGGTGLAGILPSSIQKALAIDPKPGSTYLDAEHVVILMQENRSFDHCYGTLRGVRGFNDPRAITLPNKNKVWLQTNAAGQTYAPFRLNIKDTKATWMHSLPHSWTNQVDARNNGKYDKWLEAKPSGHPEYAKMPLTLGYYNREDIPFYYALADAFTVCDQNFCSSLTGTTPNRLYLWTGTARDESNGTARARVRNEDTDYDDLAHWTTFPERLEDNGISWKIYQNEINLPTGLNGEEEAWLANFSDNPIEWFEQYHVKFSPEYNAYLKGKAAQLPDEIKALEAKVQAGDNTEKVQKELAAKKAALAKVKEDLEKWTPENFEKLSAREKALHQKAFTTNRKDPAYHQLTPLTYQDGATEQTVNIPKGDVLYQFREDVKNGTLPTVSWVVSPENFSDHPGAPWYGAWYISEMLDILTQNPDVWEKTIFVLAYDENDGYFDHVPPFVAPHPDKPETGLTSKGIDTGVEHVSRELELKRKVRDPAREARASAIGLGYRVPLVIASPWSRGGFVCSEVFDHTSVLQFLEGFLTQKTGKKIEESNITTWRRTVCGDLTSTFRPYNGEKITLPAFVAKDPFIESIHKAQFKGLPSNYQQLTSDEIQQINQDPASASTMTQQEQGVRPSCALPYQLYADGRLSADKKAFRLTFAVKNDVFGKASAGSPFNVYDLRTHHVRDYAVVAGDSLTDSLPLDPAGKEAYHWQINGPNGFQREFKGNGQDPALTIACDYQRNAKGQLTGNVELRLVNEDKRQSYTVEVQDQAYGAAGQTKTVGAAGSKTGQATLVLDLNASYGWYDFSVKVSGSPVFEKRYAGRVETGKSGYSDPAMGRVALPLKAEK